MNMVLRFICVLSLLSVACGDDSANDAGPEAPDVPAQVDAGNRDAGGRDAFVAPDIGALESGTADSGPPIDGGGFCCVPIEAADQDACRVIEALGEGACGNVGGGGVCVWSDEAACRNEEPGCCTAATTGSESFCAGLGDDECQATRRCDWSPAACSSACCFATRAGFEGMCEGLSGNQGRCESLRDCAWSDAGECSMMEPSCCLASREGFEGPCALRDASLETCQGIRDCVWSGAPECTSADEGCCVASRMGFEDLCASYESQVGCQMVRDCAWESGPLSCG